MRAEEVEKGSNSRRHLLPVRNDGVDSNLRAALPFENEREAGSPLRTRYAGDSVYPRRLGHGRRATCPRAAEQAARLPVSPFAKSSASQWSMSSREPAFACTLALLRGFAC